MQPKVVEIDLATLTAQKPAPQKPQIVQQAPAVQPEPVVLPKVESEPPKPQTQLVECDRVELLFQKNSPLSIVQTVQYKSKVPWKSGRSAWLVDYAGHYKTHLHFIARSMNGRPDYNARPATEGQYFNILSPTVNFYFYIGIDISRCQMLLYAVMPDTQEHILLKTYRVGLGRLDPGKASGSLTPIGKYSLGSRIAIYQPKMMGSYRGKRTEMITVFGTRWIPFDKELENCSEPAKGFGIHGTPWRESSDGRLADDTSSIGKYESDGCIRLRAQDAEEIFSIVSTHQTIVEIVTDFSKVTLPGNPKML